MDSALLHVRIKTAPLEGEPPCLLCFDDLSLSIEQENPNIRHENPSISYENQSMSLSLSSISRLSPLVSPPKFIVSLFSDMINRLLIKCADQSTTRTQLLVFAPGCLNRGLALLPKADC